MATQLLPGVEPSQPPVYTAHARCGYIRLQAADRFRAARNSHHGDGRTRRPPPPASPGIAAQGAALPRESWDTGAVAAIQGQHWPSVAEDWSRAPASRGRHVDSGPSL